MGNFCPNLEKNEFFWIKCSVSFLIFQLSTMVQKIRKKLTDRQTDRQIDREQWFFRTLHRTCVQKIKFAESDSHWGGKNNRQLNPFIKIMVRWSNIHYSKINQTRNWKKHIQFLLELQKNETSEATNSVLHLERWARYFRQDTQLNSMLKTKWIQSLLNPTNAFWKDLWCIGWT